MMTRKMEFSYKDGEDYVFSDPETYETVTLAAGNRWRRKELPGGKCAGDSDFCRGQGGLNRIAVERGAEGVRRA